MTERTPQPLTAQEAATLTERSVSQVKRLDCSFYRQCLDVAVQGDWEGFGCAGCQAHQAMDTEQRVWDWMALRTLDEAANNVDLTTTRVEKNGKSVIHMGKAGRRRGVKPGADSSPKLRLKVIQESAQELGMAKERVQEIAEAYDKAAADAFDQADPV